MSHREPKNNKNHLFQNRKVIQVNDEEIDQDFRKNFISHQRRVSGQVLKNEDQSERRS